MRRAGRSVPILAFILAACGPVASGSAPWSADADADATLLPAVDVADFKWPFSYSLPVAPKIEARREDPESFTWTGPDAAKVSLWLIDGWSSGVADPCASEARFVENYTPIPSDPAGLIAYLGDLPGAELAPVGEGAIGALPGQVADLTIDGCRQPILWKTSLRAGPTALRVGEGEPMRLVLAEGEGGTAVAAVTGQDRDAWHPTASGILAAIEFAPRSAQAHCSAAVDYQIAYDVAGEDEVEVSCGIVYKRIGDLDATLDLYLPPGTDADARLPAVVFVHGNEQLPEALPLREEWGQLAFEGGRMVAASGMAGIAFAYRGYRDAESLGDAQQDVLDLIEYLAAHADELNVDPERICVWGTSGGGYPAAWAALFASPRPACGVFFSASLDASWAPEQNPAEFVNGSLPPPIFIARGLRDSYGSVTRFVERATAAGVEVVLEEHPGGHAFESEVDAEQQRIVGAALDFVSRHLGAD